MNAEESSLNQEALDTILRERDEKKIQFHYEQSWLLQVVISLIFKKKEAPH
jgi:hypothetical protein